MVKQKPLIRTEKEQAETQLAQEQHKPEHPDNKRAFVQKLLHGCSFCFMALAG